jgi:NADH:ubiquinone oxidoreductase subunit 6 (subunit J)
VSNPRETIGKNGTLGTKLVIAGALLAVLLYTIYEWIGLGKTGEYFILSNFTNSIGNLLFTEWGAVILVFGLVLFSAMLGGVFIAQEEDE